MTAGSRGSSIRPLGKILQSLPQPVYVVDPSGEFIYGNEACREWIGPVVDQLASPGKQSSDSDEIASLRESLRGPSLVHTGQSISQPVSPDVLFEGDRPATKEFLFIPLGENPLIAILAVGDCHVESEVATSGIDLAAISRRLAATRRRYPKLSRVPTLIGSSIEAAQLRRKVAVATESSANILLVGSPTAGSESIALAIHRAASNKSIPLTPIDCSLMDDELFQAAMSPVIARLAGDGETCGCVLLRDIDRLAADAQGTLLAYLREFDDRLRCLSLATNPMLSGVQQESFNANVASRLSTIEIVVPSLTDRINDLPEIVHFLIESRTHAGTPIAGIARPALDRLSTYPWPGDFDELDATIRHCVRECRGAMIGPQHLPLAIRSYKPHDLQELQDDGPIDLDRFLARIERELIDRALVQCDGNKAEAARRLGISRARLLRRIDDIAAPANDEA